MGALNRASLQWFKWGDFESTRMDRVQIVGRQRAYLVMAGTVLAVPWLFLTAVLFVLWMYLHLTTWLVGQLLGYLTAVGVQVADGFLGRPGST